MRRILFILAMLVSAMTYAAENYKFDPEAYKAEQHKYIVCKAELTSAEAAKFFPVYDEMREKERKLFVSIRECEKQKPQNEAEYRRCIEKRDELEMEIKKVSRQYHQKLFKILPSKKVYMALRASERFDRKQFMNSNYKGVQEDKNRKNVKK